MSTRTYPSEEECIRLLEEAGCKRRVIVHCCTVCTMAEAFARRIDCDKDLLRAGALLHDIGRSITHSIEHALIGYGIVRDLGLPEEIAEIVTAIGNHDEGTGVPVNAVAAAMILADKADVRRSRVRNTDMSTFDIHDRVNYSVKKSALKINEDKTIVKLKLTVDTKFGSVMDYFEIFMQRMILCRKAAEKLGLQFKLIINEQQLI